ncbi:MAG: hypothetical protein ACOYYS_17695 [Chloroflexota bacterium]
MQKEIRISKRLLGLLAFLAAATIAAISVSLPGEASGQEPTAAATAISPSGAVAQAGVAATFTAGYREKDAWLDGICALSTETACRFYRDFVAAGAWPKLEAAKANVSAEATAIEKVDEIQSVQDDGSVRLLENWKVAVKLSRAWPARQDDRTEFAVYAQVAQEGGAWKFASILLDGQAEKYEGK